MENLTIDLSYIKNLDGFELETGKTMNFMVNTISQKTGKEFKRSTKKRFTIAGYHISNHRGNQTLGMILDDKKGNPTVVFIRQDGTLVKFNEDKKPALAIRPIL